MRFFCVVLLCLYSSILWAYKDIEDLGLLGPNDQDINVFEENPAKLYNAVSYGATLLINQNQGVSEFAAVNDRKIITDNSATSYGLGLASDLGSGLIVGGNIQQISETDLTRSMGVRSINETFKTQMAKLKVAIQILEQMAIGVFLNTVKTNNDIVGSLFVDANSAKNHTTYTTNTLGSGAGIVIRLDGVTLAGCFLQPLHGKSLVQEEAKIVSEPGKAILQVNSTNSGLNYGFLYRRWIYKKSDLSQGSTLDNDNNTSISLLGLNIWRNKIFPLHEKQISFSYPIDKGNTLELGVSQVALDFVDIAKILPSSNSSGRKLTEKVIRLAFLMQRDYLVFSLRFHKQFLDENFLSNRGETNISASLQDVVLGVSAKL